MKLLEVNSGEQVVITRVKLDSNLIDYAESRGVFVGNILRILLRYKSQVLVELDQSVFLLPPKISDKIEVKKL